MGKKNDDPERVEYRRLRDPFRVGYDLETFTVGVASLANGYSISAFQAEERACDNLSHERSLEQ